MSHAGAEDRARDASDDRRPSPPSSSDAASGDETLPAPPLPAPAPAPSDESIDPNATAPSPEPAVDPNATVAAPTPTAPADPNATAPAAPPAASTPAPADPDATVGAAAPSPTTPPASGPPATGPVTAVGGYPVEAELGRGGMGIVYRAVDPRLKRPVALKVLTSAIERDSEAYLRFEREAQALATLHHPNIATIFSLEEADGAPFFTMEWIEGGTLAHRLEKGPLSLDETLSVARQVARALEAAHARGIVHRDLKPANVMVTADGTAKILDFGIAAAFGQWETIAPSTAAEVSGTPAYMSPEQYRGLAVDPTTDAWSFGCLLYECCTGTPVFRGTTVGELREAVLTQEPDWSRIPEGLPARVHDLVRHCLQKDARERLSSLTEARRALEDQLVREGVTARLADIAPTTRRPATATLPRSLTKFVGREDSLAAIREQIDEIPLVTLTGAGGCGKSRLALEAARGLGDRFPDGIRLVELAAVEDPTRVVATIAKGLEIREIAGEDLETTVTNQLQGRRVLILLDNCEHLLEECARVVESFLSHLPELRVIASSREALSVMGEEVIAIPPLDLPKEGKRYKLAELEKLEAVQLFLDRARGVKRNFTCRERDAAALAQVVRRLDGIPLAIELAAARVKVLPLEQISKRLDDRFRLLTGGSRTALPRQQTLRATIEWSHELLEEDERQLLHRLSVFVGGFTLEAVEAVCSGGGIEEWEVLDRLTLLVDKSLVEVEAPDDDEDALPRYRLLETVREYAHERFSEEPDTDATVTRHFEHFLELATSEEKSGEAALEWHRRLDAERWNLRAAFEHALAAPERSADALAMVRDLGNHWLIRGEWTDGRSSAERALEHDAERSPPGLRAAVIAWISRFTTSQGDHDTARAWVERGLALAREADDRPAIAGATNDLGVIARQRGALDEARDAFRETIAIRRELGDDSGLAVGLHNLAICELQRQDLDAAQAALEESRAILRREGNQQRVTVSLMLSGSIAFERGDLDEAQATYEEALEVAEAIDDRRAQRNLQNNLGLIAIQRGDLAEADRRHQESLIIREELGDRVGQLRCLATLASIAAELGDLERARERARAAIDLSSGNPGEVDDICASLIPMAVAHGDLATAVGWLPALERTGTIVAAHETWPERLRARAGDDFEAWRAAGEEADPDSHLARARTVLDASAP